MPFVMRTVSNADWSVIGLGALVFTIHWQEVEFSVVELVECQARING